MGYLRWPRSPAVPRTAAALTVCPTHAPRPPANEADWEEHQQKLESGASDRRKARKERERAKARAEASKGKAKKGKAKVRLVAARYVLGLQPALRA